MIPLTDPEFHRFQRFISEAAGLPLSDAKTSRVVGWLIKRVKAQGCKSFDAYCDLLSGSQAGTEVQTAIDLLTTNETFFFRESKHFERLRQRVQFTQVNLNDLDVGLCQLAPSVYAKL